MDQIKKAIAAGRLPPDTALPSVRQLSTELRVNPNTIARAYRELEYEGVIYKRAGAGTYVSDRQIDISRREKMDQVGALIEKAVVEGLNLGLEEKDIRDAFDETMKKIRPDRQTERRKSKKTEPAAAK